MDSLSFNFINYLRIIDLSILNLFDYIDISQTNGITEVNDRYILNFNSSCRKLLEGFVINNINDSIYYGRKNILINTCSPSSNWRSYKREKSKKPKIYLADDSIHIDEIKLNQFIDQLYKKLPGLNATLNSKSRFQTTVVKTPISLQKNIALLEFDNLDQYDLLFILNKILSSFGTVNKDECTYNIIQDYNFGVPHKEEIGSELFQEVHSELIKKGII